MSFLRFFSNLPLDTQANIKGNREKYRVYVEGNKFSGRLKELLYDWEHYFDKGYKAKWNIDEGDVPL